MLITLLALSGAISLGMLLTTVNKLNEWINKGKD
jgi:hypothetical protein